MEEGWSSHNFVASLLGLVGVGWCCGLVLSGPSGHSLKLGDSVSDGGWLVLVVAVALLFGVVDAQPVVSGPAGGSVDPVALRVVV